MERLYLSLGFGAPGHSITMEKVASEKRLWLDCCIHVQDQDKKIKINRKNGFVMHALTFYLLHTLGKWKWKVMLLLSKLKLKKLTR